MTIQPGLFAIIILILEIAFLYLFSRLITNSLAKLFYHHIHNSKIVINIFAVILLPGTIIHELAHILIAGVLLVPVGEIDFLPEIHEKGVRLGTAEIGQTDIFRSAIIGVAPVIVGLFIMISLLWLNLLNFKDPTFLILGKILLGYLIFVIANTMFSSRKDLEGVGAVVLFIVLILVVLYFFRINQPFNWAIQFLDNNQDFLNKVATFLILPILIDIGILLFIKLQYSLSRR